MSRSRCSSKLLVSIKDHFDAKSFEIRRRIRIGVNLIPDLMYSIHDAREVVFHVRRRESETAGSPHLMCDGR